MGVWVGVSRRHPHFGRNSAGSRPPRPPFTHITARTPKVGRGGGGSSVARARRGVYAEPEQGGGHAPCPRPVPSRTIPGLLPLSRFPSGGWGRGYAVIRAPGCYCADKDTGEAERDPFPPIEETEGGGAERGLGGAFIVFTGPVYHRLLSAELHQRSRYKQPRQQGERGGAVWCSAKVAGLNPG